jgi:predicted Fe-Mo cluster-binding NifX family protein
MELYWSQNWPIGLCILTKGFPKSKLKESDHLSKVILLWMMRVIIPVLDRNHEHSRVSPHFGRAPYLAVVEVEDAKIRSMNFVQGEGPHEENRSEEEKSKASSIHGKIMDLKPDAIVATRIGPRAVDDFTKAGIEILPVEGNTISEIIPKLQR